MLARCVVGADQNPVRGLQQPNRELGVAEVYAGHQIAGTADDPEPGLGPDEQLAALYVQACLRSVVDPIVDLQIEHLQIEACVAVRSRPPLSVWDGLPPTACRSAARSRP